MAVLAQQLRKRTIYERLATSHYTTVSIPHKLTSLYMSKNSNEKKSKQLGMNHSTAQGRLKKRILFMLVQRLKLDTCFQCKNLIVDVDDLSVDHKKPWLDEDTRLFWDMGNIAFSHRDCNSLAARHNPWNKNLIAPQNNRKLSIEKRERIREEYDGDYLKWCKDQENKK